MAATASSGPPDLWQTFFSSSLGVSIPILVNHPRTLCACNKHLLGHLPDHVHCCQSVAASTQAHDWAVMQLKPLFGSLGHEVRVQTAVTASRGKQRGDVQIRDFLHHNGAPRDLVFFEPINPTALLNLAVSPPAPPAWGPHRL